MNKLRIEIENWDSNGEPGWTLEMDTDRHGPGLEIPANVFLLCDRYSVSMKRIPVFTPSGYIAKPIESLVLDLAIIMRSVSFERFSMRFGDKAKRQPLNITGFGVSRFVKMKQLLKTTRQIQHIIDAFMLALSVANKLDRPHITLTIEQVIKEENND